MATQISGNIGVVFDRSELAEKNLLEGAAKAIGEAALDVEALAKLGIMTPPKTGRIYKRKGVNHQASAPGEHPANDLGDLVNSITPHLENATPAGLEAEVTADSDHAVFLEFGTVHMAPRPFMLPAAEEAGQVLDRKIRDLKIL